MHVRIRIFGKADTIVVVESKLTKIDQFRQIIRDKFSVEPNLQRLFYGGKLLENGYTFHDYNIKLNDVIQLMVRTQPEEHPKEKEKSDDKEPTVDEKAKEYKDAESTLYAVGDLVDIKNRDRGSWHEGKITRIVHNPDIPHIPELNDMSNQNSEVLTKSDNADLNHSYEKENEIENLPPSRGSLPDTRNIGITRHFIKQPKSVRVTPSTEHKTNAVKTTTDANLLFKVQIDADEEESDLYCDLHEIVPQSYFLQKYRVTFI